MNLFPKELTKVIVNQIPDFRLLNPFRVQSRSLYFPRIPSGVIQIKPLRGLYSEILN